MSDDVMTPTQPQPTAAAAPTAAAIVPAQRSAALDATPAASGMVSPFSSTSAFAAAQRMAAALAASNMVPDQYRNNLPNCLIALELASRIGVSVLAAMQNLDVIHGTPSWRAKFLIATVNASGRFTPLRFEWQGEPGKDSWACRARAKDKESGEVCEGPWITWLMATKEGWTTKKGSKWQTMAELMFCYRAAAFWCRLYCPEISIGFQTSEEIHDTYGETTSTAVMPAQLTPAGAKSLEAVIGLQSKAEQSSDEQQQPSASVDDESKKKRAAAAEPKQVEFDKTTGEVKS